MSAATASKNRLQGRGALQLFELDTLRVDDGPAMIETEEGVQIALNTGTVAKILSRWQKDKPLTRIIRLERGEVWLRGGPGVGFDVETPHGVVTTEDAEIDVKMVPDSEVAAAVVAGAADFATPFTTCSLRAGTVSYSSPGKPCTAPVPSDIRSATTWARSLLAP